MPVVPENQTLDALFAATLSHEMKTPLAALQAAAQSLRSSLASLAGAAGPAGGGTDLQALEEIVPVVAAGLGDPSAPPPPTGLEAQRRVPAIAERLRRAGVSRDAETAAGVVVRWGWEPSLDAIGSILARRGARPLLDVLEAAGKFRSSLRSIEASVARLAHLVAALRDGLGAPPPAARFGLRACLEDALSVLRHSVPQGVAVDLRCDEAIQIYGSAAQIQQVATNLVGNALEAAGPRGGRVEIEGALDGAEAVIRVTDDGPGIPHEIRGRLFAPFVTTKAPGRGTGLGLFISRRIAENHGGALTFESEPGRTCFVVRLPRGGRGPAAAPRSA